MTTAEINILLRARAREARAVFAAVTRDLYKIVAAGAQAGAVLDALTGASSGYISALGGTSAAAAQLAAALAQINRSGTAASKHVLNLGVAAELAAGTTLTAATSADALAAALLRVSGAAATAATNLGAYTAAAKSAASAAKAAASATNAAAAGAGASAAATAAGAAATGSSLARISTAQNAAARSARGLSADAYAMGDTIRAQATRLNADGTVWNQFDKGLKAIGYSHERTGKAFQDTTGSVVDQSGKVQKAGRDWGALNQKLMDGSTAMRKAGSQMQWTGRQLSVMFTAPTLLAGGLGVMWALEYEKAFTRIKKVYNGNMDELGGMGPEFSGSKFDKFFTALSNRMGFAREEIADIAADFAQAGLSGAQLAKATKLTAEFSIVGDQDLKKSTQDIISVMAQYKLSSDEMAEAIAHLNAISNETPVSMADLTAGFVRTASVAKEAGVDVRHLGAFIAALTPAAGTAAVSANGLKSVFTRLMVPTKEAAGVLEQVGINIGDPNWISKNAVERLSELSERFEGLSQQQKFDLAKPFAGLYQINKFVALMDDMASAQGNYAKALAATESPAKSFATYSKELNAFLNSNPQKLKQAGAIIKNSLADAVIPLIPHIVWLAQSLAKAMNAFSNMSPEMQKFIIYCALALAAVGPLAMLIGSFAILFGVAGKSMALFGKLVAGTAFHLFGFGKATKMVGDDVVKRTPFITRAWRAMMTAMRGITTVGAAAINGIWKLGMGLFALILRVGGALGLKNFSWYQAMMVRVNAAAQSKIVAQTAAGQRAATAAVAAGGRAQTAAATSGAAGATAAARAGGRGWLMAIVAAVALFPGTIWKWLKQVPDLFKKAFGHVTTVLREFGRIFTGGATAGWAKGLQNALYRMLAPVTRWAGVLWRSISGVIKQIGRIFTGGATAGWAKGLENALFRMLAPITRWAGTAWRALSGFFVRIAPTLARSLVSVVPRIAASVGAIAAGISGPIGWAIAGVVSLIMLFPRQIWNAVKGIGKILVAPFVLGLRAIGTVFGGAYRYILGAAAGIREGVYKIFTDDGIPFLAKPFVAAVEVATGALRALPGIVVAVFKGVVKVIQSAAKAVYEAFSYINPFAHHSPSLVENVTGGMAIVRDEFEISAASIEASTKRAYNSISAMGQLTAGLRGRVEGMKREETLTKIGEADPASNRAYLMLEATLPGLKGQLESANRAIADQEARIKGLQAQVKIADKALDGMSDQLDVLRERADAATAALDKAKEQLDYYANAPIAGMRAMSDAIFENEMAQKRLRLEIMKMEEAGQTVDDLADRMAKLQGQIETLSGEREGLRMAGAGSDILGVYDRMIADLEAQQGAVATDQLKPIEEAQKQLEELQRRGEQLDLENALKFDPLTRQIQQMVDTSRELSFAEITAGIRTNQAAVNALTVEYERANQAVVDQEAVIKSAEQARDALNDQIEIEQERLDSLTDAQKGLEDAISDVESAMEDIVGWVDSLNQLLEENEEKTKKSKDAAEDLAAAWDNAALGDFETGAGLLEAPFDDTDIDKMTEELTNQVAEMFDGIDIGGAIKGFFGRIGSWFLELPGRIWGWLSGIPGAIGRQIGEWAGSVGSWFAGVGSSIGSWFADLPGLIAGKIGEWASQAGSWFAGVGRSIGSWFGNLWRDHIWPGLRSLPGKIISFLASLPGEIVSALSYLVGYLAGTIASVFVGAFRVGQAIYSYFADGGFIEDVTGVWEVIRTWFTDNVWQPFMDFVTGTIPDIGRSIYNYFAEGGFTEDVAAVWDAVQRWWTDDVWGPFSRFFTERIPEIGRAIYSYFADGGFAEDVASVWDAVQRWWTDDVWGPFSRFFTERIPEIGRGIANYFTGGGFLEDLGGIWDKITEIGGNIISGLWDGIRGAMSNAWQWIRENVVDPVINGFKDALGIHSPSTVFKEIGGFLIDGLWEGIKNAGGWFLGKVTGWVEDHIPGPIKRIMEIGSPSKLMARYGGWIAEGLANGIEGGGARVGDASAALAAAAGGVDAPLPAAAAAFDATFTGISGATMATTQAMYDGMVASGQVWAVNSNGVYTGMSAQTQATLTQLSSAMSTITDKSMMDLASKYASGRDAVVNTSASMTDTVTTNFQSLATNLATIFNDQIAPVFNAFDPALGAVSGWFSDAVGNIGSTWAGIREPVAVPARFVINDVYNDGIRGAWNKFNEFLGLPALGEQVARFAAGGPIVGAGTGTSDSILARVANGEHVITAAEVRGAGGHRAIEAARAAWKQGLPAFAAGGPVDLNAAPWGGGGGESNLKPAAILARRNIHKYWPSVGTIGGYRAQDAYPDHPSGLALDVMTGDPIGTEINDWLHRQKDALALNYTIWKQWYKPAGGIGNLMEDRGSITQNHMDHVHALFNANGVAGIQDGGVGSFTVPMDQVVRDAINAQMDAVAGRAPQLAGGIGRWPSASVDKARAQLLEFMVPKAAELSKATSGAGATGSAESWRAMAIEAMKRNGFAWQNEEQVSAMLRQIMKESSGNAAAIQKVIDINSGGNEAAGLLQITPRTWAAFRDPSLPDNRLDPWANMNGALRYYKSKYGMDLTTMWGRGHGYDNGGWLPPTPGGFGTFHNLTGKPEAVLTSEQWGMVGQLAQAVQALTDAKLVEAVTDALEGVFGSNPTRDQAERLAQEYQDANKAWTPAFYGAAAAQEQAANTAAKAAGDTATAAGSFADTAKQIAGAASAFAAVAVAIATAAGSETQNFETWAPVLGAVAGFLEGLPKATPTYVSWAGTDTAMTGGMVVQKGLNDVANVGKGLFNIVRDVAPKLLNTVATVGVGIAKLAADNGPLISAALAMLPVNPIGAAIMAAPVLLQGITTLLPTIIEAVTQIVPALISGVFTFFERFMPNSVFAHETLAAAEKAAQESQSQYQSTGSLNGDTSVKQVTNTKNTTLNIYGVTMPNITNGNDAERFINGLTVLADN